MLIVEPRSSFGIVRKVSPAAMRWCWGRNAMDINSIARETKVTICFFLLCQAKKSKHPSNKMKLAWNFWPTQNGREAMVYSMASRELRLLPFEKKIGRRRLPRPLRMRSIQQTESLMCLWSHEHLHSWIISIQQRKMRMKITVFENSQKNCLIQHCILSRQKFILKVPKMDNWRVSEKLKLMVNNVTRQVNLNWTKIGGKCQS